MWGFQIDYLSALVYTVHNLSTSLQIIAVKSSDRYDLTADRSVGFDGKSDR